MTVRIGTGSYYEVWCDDCGWEVTVWDDEDAKGARDDHACSLATGTTKP